MLCGQRLPLRGVFGIAKAERGQVTSWEHVTPRSRSRGRPKNRTLTHISCNTEKGSRMPYACELLFLEFTNEIVEDLT
jgi:hypothetical protein